MSQEENKIRFYKYRNVHKSYGYVFFTNPYTKEKLHVTESRWLSDKEEVINYSKDLCKVLKEEVDVNLEDICWRVHYIIDSTTFLTIN
jgi:hypothetical protein